MIEKRIALSVLFGTGLATMYLLAIAAMLAPPETDAPPLEGAWAAVAYNRDGSYHRTSVFYFEAGGRGREVFCSEPFNPSVSYEYPVRWRIRTGVVQDWSVLELWFVSGYMVPHEIIAVRGNNLIIRELELPQRTYYLTRIRVGGRDG